MSPSSDPAALAALVRQRAAGTRAAADWLDAAATDVAAAATALLACVDAGGTVFTCGNGGSAAEALHLAEELTGYYRDHDRAPVAAVSLSADPTAMSCIANDAGFEMVFARPLQALGRAGDVLVALTTSGNSENVVRALDVARTNGLTTIGLLGGTGGRARERCDHALVVDAPDTAAVQEGHLALVHVLCEAVEVAVLARTAGSSGD